MRSYFLFGFAPFRCTRWRRSIDSNCCWAAFTIFRVVRNEPVISFDNNTSTLGASKLLVKHSSINLPKDILLCLHARWREAFALLSAFSSPIPPVSPAPFAPACLRTPSPVSSHCRHRAGIAALSSASALRGVDSPILTSGCASAASAACFRAARPRASLLRFPRFLLRPRLPRPSQTAATTASKPDPSPYRQHVRRDSLAEEVRLGHAVHERSLLLHHVAVVLLLHQLLPDEVLVLLRVGVVGAARLGQRNRGEIVRFDDLAGLRVRKRKESRTFLLFFMENSRSSSRRKPCESKISKGNKGNKGKLFSGAFHIS